uniref:Fes1 domain-containing protein n=1 Tax=Syphacia muris TaxID=451379 RepID=A0A0N5AFI5_9BILA
MSDNSGNVPDAAWKQLFVAAQSLNDGTSSGTPKQMSAEDRNFLENAMSEMVRKTDPVRQMIEHIKELREIKDLMSNVDIDKICLIVDQLENIVCNVDCAVDFCKLGGISEIQRFMDAPNDEAKIEVMRLLPTVLQNNPGAQVMVLKTNLLTSLLSILNDMNESTGVKIKALSAISALIRSCDAAYSLFRSQNGFKAIEDVFNKSIAVQNDKLASKAAVTLTSIANDLGYESSLDIGLPTVIVRMYAHLTANSLSISYLRSYVSENLNIKKIDAENRNLILRGLERDLKFERESPESDKVRLVIL